MGNDALTGREGLYRPLTIGSLTLDGNLLAAPMAGVTDSAFRKLLRRHGAALTYTEMVSAKALYYKNENTAELLAYDEDEAPVAVQLFGSDPMIIAEQAALLKGRFPLVDLNMGCPAPKIVKNHEGSALLDKPELIREIIETVVDKVDVPVTVKFRKGIRSGEDKAVEIARIAEQAGAAAIALHARTASEMYSGHADWDAIRRVKEAISIPVIGNGDITSPEECERMLRETGCDAVMIGRATRGNPWIFEQCRTYLQTGVLPEAPSQEEILDEALLHARLIAEKKGEARGMAEMRSHLLWYLKGMPGATAKKRLVTSFSTLAEVERFLLTRPF